MTAGTKRSTGETSSEHDVRGQEFDPEEAAEAVKEVAKNIRDTSRTVRKTVTTLDESGAIEEIADAARDTTQDIRDTAEDIQRSGVIEDTAGAIEETTKAASETAEMASGASKKFAAKTPKTTRAVRRGAKKIKKQQGRRTVGRQTRRKMTRKEGAKVDHIARKAKRRVKSVPKGLRGKAAVAKRKGKNRRK
ncbi:hypothetical protein NTE_02014 [Candidatus Nitrososphaera evergladensis SR1]|uniref:Uncharacterized protein n=1 Tax=Candidatus Nitrososphaera evergladensis SR1 TaxID=1459636 RepID=A0A075MR79_9ARCH|nr:hypothetical protein [Candidatus Nitrososphaera evergladensis]AIF84071.1 hypothetical protein NTE_02014 [Candidatus Nitrososphaera evergladensis SR1]